MTNAANTATLSIALIGPGLVGAEFLAQIAAFQATGATAPRLPHVRLAVVAVANSRRQLLASAPAGIPLSSWRSMIEDPAKLAPLDIQAFLTHAAANAPCVLVDATSNDDIAAIYPDAVATHGLHIVTPNKKAFSGDLGLFRRIFQAAADHHKFVLHESTVGAGLPILSTLNDLVATGDDIVRIEGIFSGTLSYIFNQFSTAASSDNQHPPAFSSIVKTAKELGYTEPDPRDDLNGMDVARKVVILGRLAGLDLTTDTLDVENIVPQALRSAPTAADFLARLPDFDSEFADLNAAAAREGAVLRYVGVVDSKNGKGSVKLMKYPSSHPFASLTGSDNIIAFTTKRFPSPLIVQGAGAGAAVTAFGMFSDILKITRSM